MAEKKTKAIAVAKTTKKSVPKKSKPAEIKTKETAASVEDFIKTIPGEQKQKDSLAIIEMMKKATGEKAKMWGSAIIGFGNKRYKSPTSGREVDWFIIGFAPRKAALTLYLTTILHEKNDALEKLGKYKTGGGCLYINKLEDVDTKVLKGMIDAAAKRNKTL
jgi:hypothetical protein